MKTNILEINEKIANITVNSRPNAVIKGYKMAKTTFQILDFFCMMREVSIA